MIRSVKIKETQRNKTRTIFYRANNPLTRKYFRRIKHTQRDKYWKHHKSSLH